MIKAPKKLIEVALPLDDINEAAAREKNNPFLAKHPRSIHTRQEIHQHIADDDVPHESGDAQLGVLIAETIQPLLNGTQRDDLL